MSERVLRLYARRLGLTFEQYKRYASGAEPWPVGMLEAILETFEPLTSDGDASTLDTVNTSAVSSNALRSRARLSKGALKSKAIQVLAKKGTTIAEVSIDLEKRLGRKVPRSTVQAWVKQPGDPSYRAIPEDAANAMKDLYGVSIKSWSRIIPGV